MWCGSIFENLVAFSERRQFVGNLSQGAGELGPLGKHICVNIVFTI